MEASCLSSYRPVTDKLLDTLQEKGNVNTVFAYTYDYDPNRTTEGGPIPLPDHGKYGPAGKFRTGGAFYDYDQKYFRGTTLKDFRSPDEPGFNVITAVSPKMKARKMDFFAWDYNNAFPVMMQSIPGFTEVAEVQPHQSQRAGYEQKLGEPYRKDRVLPVPISL